MNVKLYFSFEEEDRGNLHYISEDNNEFVISRAELDEIIKKEANTEREEYSLSNWSRIPGDKNKFLSSYQKEYEDKRLSEVKANIVVPDYYICEYESEYRCLEEYFGHQLYEREP